MDIVVAPIDHDCVMPMATMVVMMPWHATFMHGTMDVDAIVVPIDDDLTIVTVMRRATTKASIWEDVGKRAALDVDNVTWRGTASTGIDGATMHVDVIMVSIDDYLSHRVEVRVGAALELLPRISREDGVPFDLTFIDADKENNAPYFEWALKLSRVGSLIITDNVVRKGAVIDSQSPEASVQGVRRFYERVAAEPRVTATAIQTVGSKGYDGFSLARVRA